MAAFSRQELENIANAAAQRWGIPRDVFFNLINHESGWQTDAVSHDKYGNPVAYGLTQMINTTAGGFGLTPQQLLDRPDLALDAGAHYLSDNIRQFGGDVAKGVAAYFLGAGNIQAAINRGGENWLAEADRKAQDYDYPPGTVIGYLKNLGALDANSPAAAAGPKGPNDRTFAQIQGTSYLSPEERAWYKAVESGQAPPAQPPAANASANAAPAPPPQQGNAPMPGPQTDFQKWLADGRDVVITHPATFPESGLYTGYYTKDDGSRGSIVFFADGTSEYGAEFGTPLGQTQYDRLRESAAANGAPDTGGLPVVSRESEAGNRIISIKPGSAAPPGGTSAPAAPGSTTTPAGSTSANATAAAAPVPGGFAQATTPTGTGSAATDAAPPNQPFNKPAPNTAGTPGQAGAQAGGLPPKVTAVNPNDAIPGTGGQVRTAPLPTAPVSPPPRPVGYAPPNALPEPGKASNTAADYYRSIIQEPGPTGPGGIPLYFGDRARTGGYPTIASASPGSVSVVSQQGGLGYNPYMYQLQEKGLSSFGIPPAGVSISKADFERLQTNPYGADNPYEQARLSGGLVKPPTFTTNGLGQIVVGYAGGGSIGGNGGLRITEPSVIIPMRELVPGQNPVATLGEVREEGLMARGGLIAVDNSLPGTSRYDGTQYDQSQGVRRYAGGGSFGGGFGDNGGDVPIDNSPISGGGGSGYVAPAGPANSGFGDQPVTGGLNSSVDMGIGTGVGSSVGNSMGVMPATTSTLPLTAPITVPQPTSLSGLPAIPVAPNVLGSATDSNVVNFNGRSVYEQEMADYLTRLEGAGSAQQADLARQRGGLATNLINNEGGAGDQAIAAAQRGRATTDYKYGVAGLPKPNEVMPPVGQNGLNGGPLGPGLRWALLTDRDQYNRMNAPLATLGASISEQIQALAAQAKAEQAAYNAAFTKAAAAAGFTLGSGGGGGNGGGGGSGGLSYVNAYPGGVQLPGITSGSQSGNIRRAA